MTERVVPADAGEVAAVLRGAHDGVRIHGGATKLRWGRLVSARVELSTEAMQGPIEHQAGDLTAVFRAGTRLRDVQSVVAAAGQMLALDPPDPGGAATIGGVFAAGDSGPLRHRYGAGRDLAIGVQVVLGDGTIARSGGRVIKNVAGYDLPKLLAGSFGTLGVVTEIAVRLHPVPPARSTVVGRAADPVALQRAAVEVGSRPFELEAFDFRGGEDGPALLARVGGVATGDRAPRIADVMRRVDLDVEIVDDPDSEDELWSRQREGQRGVFVARVSAVRGEIGRVVSAVAGAGGEVVGRASLGVSWVRLPAAGGAAAALELRRAMHPRPVVVLDAPDEVRASIDPWGTIEGEALMRRVKDGFDPAGVCNPGLYREGW